MILFAPLMLVFLLVCVQAEVNFPWEMTGAPSTGLLDITFPINMAQAPRSPGYVFGSSIRFTGSSNNMSAYIGLVPELDLWPERTSTMRALFNVHAGKSDGATTTDPNCKRDSPAGSILRCVVTFQSYYNHTYNMEVRHAGSTTWAGAILDTVTGVRTQVGSWTLSSGTSGIVSHTGPSAYIRHLRFEDDKQNPCESLPWTRVFFGVPTTTFKTVSVSFNGKPSDKFNCTLKGKSNLKYEQFGNGVLADIGSPSAKGGFTFSEPVDISTKPEQVPMSG